MRCKKCNKLLSKRQIDSIQNDQDNGIDTDYVCNECAEDQNNDIYPTFEYEMHSDADIGL
jgi:protein-arginine kinase activator protein McsA